jgi:hypothetical protein
VAIELLWLVPVIAAALFLPVLMLARRRPRTPRVESHVRDLAREVDTYNRSEVTVGSKDLPAEKRLNDIELTINKVSAALSSQQKIIEGFKGKDAGHDNTLIELKEKLRELQHEYDIVISENFSLRARVGKLVEEREMQRKRQQQKKPESAIGAPDEVRGPEQKDRASDAAMNKQLYDDTRMLPSKDFNGKSEINLSEIK